MSSESSLVGNNSPHPSRDEEEGLKESSSYSDDGNNDDDQHRDNLEEAWRSENTSTVTWVMAELKRAAKDLREWSKLSEVGGGGGVPANRCREIGQLLRGAAMGTLQELDHMKVLLKRARIRASTMERTKVDLENQVEFLISQLGKATVNAKELEGQLEAMKKLAAGTGSKQVASGQSHQEESNNGSADGDESEEESDDDELDKAPPPPRSALAKLKLTRPSEDAPLVKKGIMWAASVKNPITCNAPMTSEMSTEPEAISELVLNDGDVGTEESLEASVNPLRVESPQESELGREGSEEDDDVIFLGVFENGTTSSTDDWNVQKLPGSSMGTGRVGERNMEATASAAPVVDNFEEGNVPENEGGAIVEDSYPPPPPKCTYQLRRKRTVRYNLLSRVALAASSSPSKLKMKSKVNKAQGYLNKSAQQPQFQCDKCDARFGRANNLRRHINTIHNPKPLDERSRYKCKNCPKGFYFQCDLAMHMSAHSNVRRFRCTLCNKWFKSRNNLKVHLQRHGDERPYKCKVCRKAFKTSSTLGTHVHLHSGRKSHKCQLCTMAFAQKWNLQRHERRRHTSH